jgi:hypothetical protein
MEAELEHAAKSRRLRVDAVIDAIGAGDSAAAAQHLTALGTGSDGDKAAAAIWTVLADCAIEDRIEPDLLDHVALIPPPVLTHSFASWFSLIARSSMLGSCAGLDPKSVARVGEAWLGALARGSSGHEVTLRASIAALWLNTGDPNRAQGVLFGGTRAPSGVLADLLATRIALALGDIAGADRRLSELEARDGGGDRSRTRQLRELRRELTRAAGAPAN